MTTAKFVSYLIDVALIYLIMNVANPANPLPVLILVIIYGLVEYIEGLLRI